MLKCIKQRKNKNISKLNIFCQFFLFYSLFVDTLLYNNCDIMHIFQFLLSTSNNFDQEYVRLRF